MLVLSPSASSSSHMLPITRHPHVHPSVSPSVSASLSRLSVCVSLCLCPTIHLSLCLPVCLSLSASLSSVRLSLCLSLPVYVRPSVCLALCLPVCVSLVCPSLHPCFLLPPEHEAPWSEDDPCHLFHTITCPCAPTHDEALALRPSCRLEMFIPMNE